MHQPTGTSTRQDLYTPSSDTRKHTPFHSEPQSIGRPASPLNQTPNTRESAVEPIELEHVIGYTGSSTNTMQHHPTQPDVYITCMGASIVIGRLSDAHNQEFLRAHDEAICAFSVSPSGLLIASAQESSTKSSGGDAPVVIWEYSTRKQLYVLPGFNCRVNRIAFSDDDHFLAAAGEDCRLIIWDMRTSEVVLVKSFATQVSLLNWGTIDESLRRPVYTLAFSASSQVMINTLAYDISCMQYTLSTVPCGMPSSGLVRDYLCSTMTIDYDNILAGTLAGELVIFNVDSKVYRCVIPVSSNGVHSVITCPLTGTIYAGTGDGNVNKLVGAEDSWSLAAQVHVVGPVVSLSMSSDASELLVGTSAGKRYRVLVADLSVTEFASSHIRPISGCAFGAQSDIFATISIDGTARVWDLSDYSVLAQVHEPAQGLDITFTMPVASSSSTLLITSWDDYCIRAYDAATCAKMWEIANAHRGQINTIAASEKYVVSGSSDGGVNIWSMYTRELILQFHEHKRGVSKVLVDVQQPQLVHSCGLDKSVFTYDLQKERRVVVHQTCEGLFHCMSQRVDSEQELVTGSADGRILFWDCDIADAVQQLTDPNRMKLTALSVSPSGKYLVTVGEDCQLKLYDIKQEALIACCMGHSNTTNGVAWSPDERQIVSVADDCCICIWNFYCDN